MFLCSQEPKRQRKLEPVMKRPTGMNREVYALLYSDKNDAYVAKLHLSCHGDDGLMLLLHTHPSLPSLPPTHTLFSLSHTAIPPPSFPQTQAVATASPKLGWAGNMSALGNGCLSLTLHVR